MWPLVLFFFVSFGIDCDVFPSSTVPQGVHLAYTGSIIDEVFVSFFTCSSGETPAVHLFKDEGKLLQIFRGETSRLHWRSHHDIKVSELKPGTKYSYNVGLANDSRSVNFSFQTAPSEVTGFTALVVGDMGVNNSHSTIKRVSELLPSSNFTIHLGDMAYADDFHPLPYENSSGRSYNAVYDHFLRMIEPIAANAPYMVLAGNHEVSERDFLPGTKVLNNFSAYRYKFRMPSAESGASASKHFNMWYSFRVGGVHFAVVNTESDFHGSPTNPHKFFFGPGGDFFGNQLKWLHDDLAAARADSTVRFIVVLGHRSWYGTNVFDIPLFSHWFVQSAFEPILHEFDVDLYLCGHQHFYERTEPAYRGEVDRQRGTVQIINGAGGSSEGMQKRGWGLGRLTSAGNYQTEGFGVLTLLNETTLHWTYVLSTDGTVFDELFLHSRVELF